MKNVELITDTLKQDTIFWSLIKVTDNSIPENILDDSLAFLLLPVHASCPFCRKRTIESIVKNQNILDERHFIIISANGGRKVINAFFREQEHALPIIDNRLFLDSTNEAFQYDLYTEKPTIYYTHKRKAYKKVAAIPQTVKKDLRDFFSGNHAQKRMAKQNIH